MIRSKVLPAQLLQPGRKVAQSIIDRMGRTLIGCNSTLDKYIIDSMMNLGIMSIYIQDGEYDPTDDEKNHPDRHEKFSEKHESASCGHNRRSEQWRKGKGCKKKPHYILCPSASFPIKSMISARTWHAQILSFSDH